MIALRYYVTEGGKSPFEGWFVSLDATARAKVTVALARLEQGNTSSLKGVGEGVLECRIDFGPGYRVYLARDGETLVILLSGGTKKRQQQNIAAAHAMWTDYRRRKPAKQGGR